LFSFAFGLLLEQFCSLNLFFSALVLLTEEVVLSFESSGVLVAAFWIWML
jgi:hypothetical protein